MCIFHCLFGRRFSRRFSRRFGRLIKRGLEAVEISFEIIVELIPELNRLRFPCLTSLDCLIHKRGEIIGRAGKITLQRLTINRGRQLSRREKTLDNKVQICIFSKFNFAKRWVRTMKSVRNFFFISHWVFLSRKQSQDHSRERHDRGQKQLRY